MKRIFTLLLALVSFAAGAQEPDSVTLQPTYTQVIDSALHYLDKSRIPFNTLYACPVNE